ncbi:DUF1187 family protein [Escherichia coli]|nr:DUF1187 family protein [Escherichia coli]
MIEWRYKCFSVDVHISDFICKEIHPQ